MPPISGAVVTRDKLPLRLIIVHSDGSAAPKEARRQRCAWLCFRG